MTTLTHVAVNLAAFAVLLQIKSVDGNYTDLALILSSNFIDLDHFFSRPIYHPKRNPFTTHPLHKKWMMILLISTLILFIRPIMFLGIGLLMHLLLDYFYIKKENV